MASDLGIDKHTEFFSEVETIRMQGDEYAAAPAFFEMHCGNVGLLDLHMTHVMSTLIVFYCGAAICWSSGMCALTRSVVCWPSTSLSAMESWDGSTGQRYSKPDDYTDCSTRPMLCQLAGFRQSLTF